MPNHRVHRDKTPGFPACAVLRFGAVLCLAVVSAFSPAVPSLAGETIIYNGSPPPELQTIETIYGYMNCLAPTGGDKSVFLEGNSVTLNSGTVGSVYGAANYVDFLAVKNNEVFLHGGEVDWAVYGGYSLGSAENNKVTISGDDHLLLAYGGCANTGNATGNTVTLYSGGSYLVYGGYANTGNATDNTVTLHSGGANSTYIYGGGVQTGNAVNNKVTISGDDHVLLAYGGYVADNGNATDNTVTISGGAIDGNVYGGDVGGRVYISSAGDAANNTVAISGGAIGGDVYGGHVWVAGNAANNTVTISGGEVKGGVYGGYMRGYNGIYYGEGNATGNTVTISGDARVAGLVCGGITYNGIAMDNTVSISGGEVESVFGGMGTDATHNTVTISGGLVRGVVGGYGGNATSNTVTISGGLVGNVYGGYVWDADNGNVMNNTVTISGGEVFGDVYGGNVGGYGNGNAVSNTVTISNSTTGGDIYGGNARDNGNATNNTVTISGGSADGYVYGGKGGNVTNNTVTISNSAIGGGYYGGSIYGGWGGSVSGNTVTISNSAIFVDVYGGRGGNATGNTVTICGSVIDGNVIGGSGYNATNNTVIISGSSKIKEHVWGGGSSPFGFATQNRVEISGDVQVDGDVYGGSGGNATDNTVTISGGVIGGDVYGGRGGDWDGGVTSNNTVTISGGTVTGNIYGSYVWDPGDAVNNTVTISGGTVTGNVYGGWSDYGNAVNNTVTISGNPVFGTDTILFGGWADDGGDAFTGNTLNLHSTGMKVAGLRNFEYLNFYVPATLGSGGIMLNVTDTAYIDATTVHLGVEGGRSPLRVGDHVVLINAGTLDGKPVNLDETVTATGMQGVSLLHEFELRIPVSNPNQLWAVLTKEKLNPQTEDFSKGFLTGMSLLNQGGDLVSRRGMSGAVRAAQAGARSPSGHSCGIFFDLSGGWSRYDTGCHVDLSSLSLMTGVAKYRNIGVGHLTVGTFFEYGNGSYDTYNSFIDADLVHGNGKLRYFGGGVLGRMDFDMFGAGNYYTEASFRAGGITNGYHNADIRDFYDLAASYDSSTAYYGFHVGGGKVWNLSNEFTFDLYTKYLWTGMQKDSVMLSTEELVKFLRVDSHRLRLGGRFTGNANTWLKPYLGAAWEYEFNGDARASTHGHAIDVPTLRGSTGIGELGVSWKSTKYRGLYADLGVQGYIGKREGVTASLTVGKVF